MFLQILGMSPYSYGLDGRGSIPVKGKIFLFSIAGPHPASFTVGTRSSFPGVKRLGREADLSI
jgi:hypothetical protein